MDVRIAFIKIYPESMIKRVDELLSVLLIRKLYLQNIKILTVKRIRILTSFQVTGSLVYSKSSKWLLMTA
jgi:hypothetical protein